MRDQVGLDVLANVVSMMRASVDGAIWLVDDDDEATFYKKCANHKAEVVPSTGLALELLDVVQKRGVEGVVACVRGSERITRDSENVFRPSNGDVASLLVASRSCDLVIEDICGPAWFTAGQKEVGSIRSRIVWIASLLHRLCERYSVYPGPMEFKDAIQWDVLDVDWALLRQTLVDQEISLTALEEVMASAARGADFDADIIDCDGRDALYLLAAATRLFKPRGITARRVVDAAEAMGMLRVAFRLDELETDEMFCEFAVSVRDPS